MYLKRLDGDKMKHKFEQQEKARSFDDIGKQLYRKRCARDESLASLEFAINNRLPLDYTIEVSDIHSMVCFDYVRLLDRKHPYYKR